jgi:hypothetical protein
MSSAFAVTFENQRTPYMDELRAQLETVRLGQYARVPYAVYPDLFPPGGRDQNARAAALNFARALGFGIENHPEDKSVWFIRNARGPLA